MGPLGLYDAVELFVRLGLVSLAGALALRLGRGSPGFVRWATLAVLAGWLLALVPAVRVPVRVLAYSRAAPEGTPVVAELGDVPAPFPWDRPSVVPWVLLACGAGVLAFAARSWRTWRIVRSSQQVADPEALAWMQDASEALGMADPPLVVLSDEQSSPMATGLWNPVVIVPSRLARELDAQGWRMVLGHEACHLRRMDLHLQTLSSLFACAFWWVPPVWWLLAEQRLSSEIEVDGEMVGGGVDASNYAGLLVRLRTAQPPGLVAAWSGYKALKARLAAMASPGAGRWSAWPAMAALVLVAVPWEPAAATDLSDAASDTVGINEVVVLKLINARCELKAVDPIGGRERPVAGFLPDVQGFDVSNDGRFVYGIYTYDPWQRMFVADAAGSGMRMIYLAEKPIQWPKMAPNDRYLLFSQLDKERWTIQVMDRYTRQLKALVTEGPATLQPSWHPNGERIAFTSIRNGDQKIWSAAVNGSGLRKLTTGPGADDMPTYSPSGRRLAYAQVTKDGNYNIFLLDIPTGRIRAIENGFGADRNPQFLDEDRVMFITNIRGQGRLRVFDVRTEKTWDVPGQDNVRAFAVRRLTPR